jgi:hypothetical protein
LGWGGEGNKAPVGNTEPRDKGEGKKADLETLAWLKEMEKGGAVRGLGVELVGCRAPGDDGVYRLKAGQTVKLQIKAVEAGHVGVWTISPDGVVTQLFPSAERKESNRLEVGQTLQIPEDDELEARADGRGERLLVLRSSQPFDPLRGEREGPYFVIRNAVEVQKLRTLVRRPGFSSKVISYEVAE